MRHETIMGLTFAVIYSYLKKGFSNCGTTVGFLGSHQWFKGIFISS